mmetsp:Transcript_11563/g.13087  ORF Transcript_11563/g.13087 Transcript_11563/m.13087 type:complete len:147 (-) Transcript_11563:44-484(-)
MKDKVREEKRQKEVMEKKQRGEASQLEQLQKYQEEHTHQLYLNQTNNASSAHLQPINPSFLVPGVGVQQAYPVVNIFPENKNAVPASLQYNYGYMNDPLEYGVQYDNESIPQNQLVGQVVYPTPSSSSKKINSRSPSEDYGETNRG